ncbi:polysaccharide biosynthesis C-terminal domain-containing protein [Granulicella sp. L60]|uniref:oligosaccharide flippase family protein n=1 Tax=Granulicella sp. L60 TaxID=1641866 RepID=UPI00131ADBD1|nr:polysaccharide biosynthesis C-terminal domain-containing protein [Granulicella sp. L60]
MNWIAMAVGMVVPFFLMPYVVRTLGPAAYGVWILAVSTVAYLNLLDLGLRSAIVRFVSKAAAQGHSAEARDAIAAALWFRLLIACVSAVASIALALAFPHLFKIPATLQRSAQITVLMCALGVAVTLVSGVFGAVLAAINRFDVLSSITVMQTLARATGVILILRSGGGLISLACWELAVVSLSGVVTCGTALKIFPDSRIRLGRPNVATLKSMWSYSSAMFLIMIAGQIIFSTDNLVIGSFLSVGLVSFYSFGGSLTVYSSQVVTALSTTFIPLASGMEASGRTEDLKKLLLRGTQATLGLVLPIGITLLFRGKTFIGLWVGKQYSEISGTVLQILLISLFFTIANNTAGNITFATGKHKAVAKVAMIEAALNLGLSIFLVKTVGIYGVAWGTSISMALIHIIFWPAYVQKTIGVSIRTYIWDGWLKVTLCSLPFAAASLAVDRYVHASSMLSFFLQIFVTLPIYFICVASIFRTEAMNVFHRWQVSRAVKTEAAL